ncbi:MAG: esterase [Pseudomonadota bacterium]
MKPASWLIAAALISSSVSGAEPELYVRGGFNGWGLDHALVDKGNKVYEVRVELSPGNHPFKVGNRDWKTEWVIDPGASVSVAPGADYRMGTRAGPEDYLFVKKTAPYLFRLDLSDRSAPVLRVTRLEALAVATLDPHQGHKSQTALQFSTWDGKRETAHFSSPDAAAPLRNYAHSTSLQLRDPGPQHVSYSEAADLPIVRSGNLAFDALFALSVSEMKQNSVASIKDGNYNGAAPIACDCFETGEKWHYVWTRDLSYAADLGLAMLDPQRVRNSLEFKLSGWRAGVARAPQVAGSADGLQIIQDTGSGGSWPVSTDRVSWAFGADKVLSTLPLAQRKAFAPRALLALSNTIDNDRLAAFDAATGLYTGEQSFLDWRDQSYAAWITSDLASMASSKALSTNVAHYKALTLAAKLAREQGDTKRAQRYQLWAAQLKSAINRHLWLPQAGMYSSLTAGHFDGAPMHKFDWLGQSLAIITGVADKRQARSILASYPHGPMGAPVIYPQQIGMPVYHNRAIWPFVTAYGLKAAAMHHNAAVADAAYATLMRGAALNLSNMENLEWLTGQPLLLDEAQPSLIGPVINSKRQLWSVGAYLGMVIENIFGLRASPHGIVIEPFITARLRRETFGAASSITLSRLRVHGKELTMRILLPAGSSGDGFYQVSNVTIDGRSAGKAIAWNRLGPSSVIEVNLGSLSRERGAIRRVTADPYAESSAVFGPREAALQAVERQPDGSVNLRIRPGATSSRVSFNIYRNGALVKRNLAATSWSDRKPVRGACYAVETEFAGSGNRSHHSIPVCAEQPIAMEVMSQGWGQPGEVLVTNPIAVARAGAYQVQLRYHNGANEINLGISGGVKWMKIRGADGKLVNEGVVQMPHARVLKGVPQIVYSTPLTARLQPGQYRIELSDFYNMSYLQANSTFSAAGGATGPSNRVDLHGVRLTPVD